MSWDNLMRELATLERNITRDFRPALRVVDTFLTQRIAQNFALRQDPAGTPWANRPSGEQATLVKSGDLRNAAVNKGPGSVSDITSDHLERGALIPYGPFMQYGVPKRRSKKRKVKYGPPKPGSAAAAKLAMKKPPRASRKRFFRSRFKKRFIGPVQMRVASRPFIGFAQQDGDRIAEIGADFIAEQLAKA